MATMMVSIEKPSLDELAHYGVKGMKWGVRKDRYESTRVKKARSVYNTQKENYKKILKEYYRKTGYGTLYSPEMVKKLQDADREFQYSKEDLKNAKILDKLEGKSKSKTQLALEEKYKNQGMSDEEAAVAAYKNLRTRKILAVAGGVTLAAIAGYAAYKYRDERVDKIIKSGTILQNISSEKIMGIRDAFYASTNKWDNTKYSGLYGKVNLQTSGQAVRKKIQTLSDIKLASKKTAIDTLSEIAKSDSNFMNSLKNYITYEAEAKIGDGGGGAIDKVIRKAQDSISKGIIDKNVYEVFNVSLVDHDPHRQKLTNKFYDTLASKGFNAIKDINDSKYSGYKALNPIIAFNTKGKVDVISVKKLAEDEVNKSLKKATAQIVTPEIAKVAAQGLAGYAAASTIKKLVKTQSDKKKIQKYRQEHPDTKMTNTEIIRMLERQSK